MQTVRNYPIVFEEGFTITRGAMKPQTFSDYNKARAAQEKLFGSTMTYKIIVPKEELEEIEKKKR